MNDSYNGHAFVLPSDFPLRTKGGASVRTRANLGVIGLQIQLQPQYACGHYMKKKKKVTREMPI